MSRTAATFSMCAPSLIVTTMFVPWRHALVSFALPVCLSIVAPPHPSRIPFIPAPPIITVPLRTPPTAARSTVLHRCQACRMGRRAMWAWATDRPPWSQARA